MRVALFTDGIYPYVIGGMQKHSYYLARYFALNKIEVDLYHTASDLQKAARLDVFNAEEKKYINSIAVPFPAAGKFPGHYVREMYAYSRSLYEQLQQHKRVDFIYVQGLCGMYLLENKSRTKIPTGVNFHGLEMFQQAADLRSKLEQYLFKKPVLRSMKNAAVVFSLGGNLTKIIAQQGIDKNKISQVPIGIDASWIRTVPLTVNKKRTFIFTGRYERRKGIEELREVIRQLLPEAEFNFGFIGAIPENKRIQSPAITYYGSISDPEKIKEVLAAADVLVCPSYSEGMPTVILEAMASGLAVIASNVGAVSEQVGAENGQLISPGNITELKNAISTFIRKPDEELLQMKQQAIDKLRSGFLWEGIIAQTIAEINAVIAKNS